MHIGQRHDNQPEREPLNPAEGLDGIRPPTLATVEDEMAWLRECQHAIDRQPHDWAVAPRCQVPSPLTGALLGSGAEVVPGRDATVGQIQILWRRGVILRGTPEGMRAAACPPSERFVIAPSQAIVSTVGTLLGGSAVSAEMLEGGAQALAALVHKGVVLDRHKPPVSQLPADVALREREADLERAKADVQAAIDALADRDDAKTQKAYVDAKLQADLAEVRVGHARKAVEAAKEAEAQRQRAEKEREIEEIEQELKDRDHDVADLRGAEILAARNLAAALRASNEHEDAMYQLRIRRNAMFAELRGVEMQFETPPQTRLGQQLTALHGVIGTEIKL